ncbi:hypothetical protein [Salinarimonas sp.]|uniref:hypothetical protein n=1 Tax=Salinarimonas sp. TaxID=2766526 RepID=UPI00391A4D09
MNRIVTATAALLIMGAPAYAQLTPQSQVPVAPESAIGVQERRALEAERGEVDDTLLRRRQGGEVTGSTTAPGTTLVPGGAPAEPDSAIGAVERQRITAEDDEFPLTEGELIGREGDPIDVPATGAIGGTQPGVAAEPQTAEEVIERRRLILEEDEVQPGGQQTLPRQ